MKKLISANLAGNILLIFLGLLVIFHILVFLKIVPSDILWGGQIDTTSANFIVLEVIALFVTLIFAVIIAAKTGYIMVDRFKKAIDIGVWIIFAYLVLNTLGNLASGVGAENLIFAPLTSVLTFFALRLAIEN